MTNDSIKWLFKSHVDRTDRHPNPTRRSSDLGVHAFAARGYSRSKSRRRLAVTARACSKSRSRSRSEEHTSELQSPCNLVCRLLLENENPDDNLYYLEEAISYPT